MSPDAIHEVEALVKRLFDEGRLQYFDVLVADKSLEARWKGSVYGLGKGQRILKRPPKTSKVSAPERDGEDG